MLEDWDIIANSKIHMEIKEVEVYLLKEIILYYHRFYSKEHIKWYSKNFRKRDRKRKGGTERGASMVSLLLCSRRKWFLPLTHPSPWLKSVMRKVVRDLSAPVVLCGFSNKSYALFDYLAFLCRSLHASLAPSLFSKYFFSMIYISIIE